MPNQRLPLNNQSSTPERQGMGVKPRAGDSRFNRGPGSYAPPPGGLTEKQKMAA